MAREAPPPRRRQPTHEEKEGAERAAAAEAVADACERRRRSRTRPQGSEPKRDVAPGMVGGRKTISEGSPEGTPTEVVRRTNSGAESSESHGEPRPGPGRWMWKCCRRRWRRALWRRRRALEALERPKRMATGGRAASGSASWMATEPGRCRAEPASISQAAGRRQRVASWAASRGRSRGR